MNPITTNFRILPCYSFCLHNVHVNSRVLPRFGIDFESIHGVLVKTVTAVCFLCVLVFESTTVSIITPHYNVHIMFASKTSSIDTDVSHYKYINRYRSYCINMKVQPLYLLGIGE